MYRFLICTLDRSYRIVTEVFEAMLRDRDREVTGRNIFDLLGGIFFGSQRIIILPTDGDCPFLVLSRTSKGQNLSLSIPALDFRVTAEPDAALVTTYMPEAEFNVSSY